jgi:GT2 family glycosyltransferase
VSYRAYRWRRPISRATVVPQADGAWLLGRRSVWERLGWMDDRYELYYEDVQLGLTLARSRGLVILPRVVGEHRGGSSASSARGLSYTLLGVSRVRYYHLARVGRFPRALGVVTSITEFAIRSLARRPEGHDVRWRTLRLQLRESASPGSVWLLGGAREMSAVPDTSN